MKHVNFVNGKEYPARTFRRWFSDQQDAAKGFGSEDAFKVSIVSGSAYKIEPGTAFAPDTPGENEKVPGLYQIVSDEPVSSTFTLATEFLWLLPIDFAEYPNEGTPEHPEPFEILSTETEAAPSPRALLLCVHRDGTVTDRRFTGTQFVVGRSGPGRRGAPGVEVPTEALAHFSTGTQYTDLATAFRYVKTVDGLWVRDQGEKGPQGPRGSQGPQGSRGEAGPAGQLGDLTTGYEHNALFVKDVEVRGSLRVAPLGSIADEIAALNAKDVEQDGALKVRARTWFTDSPQAKDGDFLVAT
ncbi:hypothetical protein ACN20G_29900 (plasmid) [Streptomyces sp. BI20]|uniref:hypothetical protein n=1 Tax=Streptomyces sp. BI20 TaxID=3403460 RepID=UPI003C72CCF8